MDLSIPTDVLPNVVSYMNIPGITRRISSEWRDVLDEQVEIAIGRISSQYSGQMRDIFGNVYTTLFTQMREALRSGDQDAINSVRTIATHAGYLPIPWNLLIYDIILYASDLYPLIENRLDSIAKTIYKASQEGYGEDSNLTLKEFSLISDRYETDEGGISFQPYNEITDVENILANGPEEYLNINGLPVLTGETIEDHIRSVQDKYYNNLYIDRSDILPILAAYLYSSNSPIPIENQTISMISHLVPEVYTSSSDSIDIQHVPIAPVIIDIDIAIMLDRPDILDLILGDTHPSEISSSYTPGYNISLYLSMMDISFNYRFTYGSNYWDHVRQLISTLNPPPVSQPTRSYSDEELIDMEGFDL